MLYYNKRVELCRRFLEWANENGNARTEENMIAFLVIKGLINEDKAIAYLSEDKENT